MSNRDWQFGDWCEYEGYRCRVVHVFPGSLKVVDGSGDAILCRKEICSYLTDCDSWDWKPPAPIDPGEGWRLLEKGENEELVEEGDEYLASYGAWVQANNWLSETRHQSRSLTYRRRVVQPLQLREGAWYERRDGEVVGPCIHSPASNSDKMPWRVGSYWYPGYGRIIACERDWDLIREVPAPTPPQPTYRPFANSEEFTPFRAKFFRHKDVNKHYPPPCYDDHGIQTKGVECNFEQAFEFFEFEDGTPFGMPE